MKVLDSDFLVAVLRNDPAVTPKLKELSSEEFATTIFNGHELLFGAEKSTNMKNRRTTEQLIASIRQLPYDTPSMHRAVKLIHHLEQHGSRIGIFDELIASICLANDATLVTRNLKHFSKIPQLIIESW